MHLLRPSFPILLALTSWVHATTEPRIDSLLPGASLPFSTPEFRDLDNDGRLDLTLTSYGWGSGNTVWLRNLGNRTFADASLIARHLTSDGQQSLVDLDGDSRPDVFTAAADPAVSGLYLPVAYLVDPSFSGRNRIQLSTESADWWMAADLDGLPGAELVAEKKSGAAGGSQLTIYSRTSGGALAIWDTTPLNLPWNGQAKLHAADFDGDGDLDFEVTSASYDSATLFERRGTTPDGKANFVAHPLAPFTLEGDLDGNGIVDHAGDTTGDFRYQLSVPGTEGLEIAPAVQPSITFPEPLYWTLQAIESVPGEPATLVFSGINTEIPTNPLSIYKVRFGDWEHGTLTHIGYPGNNLNYVQVTGVRDLDGDGFDDVVFTVQVPGSSNSGYPRPRLAVNWGSGSGYSAPVWISREPVEIASAVAADFDSDGDLDLIVSTAAGSAPLLMLNDGHGAFPVVTPVQGLIPVGGLPSGVTIQVTGCADLDGDHIPDLVVSYSRPSTDGTATTIALGRGDGTFIPGTLPPGALDFSTDWFSFAGDFRDWDGDGDLDLMGASGWKENLGGLLAEEWHPLLGGLLSTDFLGNPTTLASFTSGDLDGDGNVDFISLLYSASETPLPVMNLQQAGMGIAYADSSGGIEQVTTPAIHMASPDFLGNPVIYGGCWVADLNQDGLNDLLYREVTGTDDLGNPTTTLRWKRNPGGDSRDLSTWVTLDLPLATTGDFVWADFDGDGSKEWCSTTGYIKPTPSGPAVSPSYDFIQGVDLSTSQVLTMGDFDGDVDLDSIYSGPLCDLTLVRNLRVDERSGVSSHLRALGILGEASNPDADADGDGRSNAEELLTGSNPAVADQPPMNWLTPRLEQGSAAFQVSFRSRTDASALGFEYLLEESTDLKNWTPVDISSASVTPDAASWQNVTVPVSGAGQQHFYRVQGFDQSATH